MSGDYVRNYYGVPAYENVHVLTHHGPGVITGFDSQYVLVQVSGEKRPGRFHPTWCMRYLGIDNETVVYGEACEQCAKPKPARESVFTVPVMTPEETVRTVLGNLRLVREHRGWTAKDAGPRVGLARATVIGHETGVRRVSVNRLAVYAAAYGVTVADLFDPMLRARLATRAAA